MYPFSIGVILDSFRTDLYSSIEKAADAGVSGLQVYATRGEMAPENMTPEKIRAFKTRCGAKGLTISALCGDLGQGFSHAHKNPALIEKSKRILDLARELGTNIVTTHIGVVPEDNGCETYRVMQQACRELAEYADSMDAHFAIETGPEPADRLKAFLDTLGSTGVAVNLDPANLTMVTGDDAVQAVYTLRDYIVHTHAKDGRMLGPHDTAVLYDGVMHEVKAGSTYIELPLGQGDVDFINYLKALHDIGYTGFLTIEREVGDQPEEDIRRAVTFLTNLIQAEG